MYMLCICSMYMITIGSMIACSSNYCLILDHIYELRVDGREYEFLEWIELSAKENIAKKQ